MDKDRTELTPTEAREGKILGTGRMRNVLMISLCGAIAALAVLYLLYAG
jgi:hypothetical protein